VKILGDYHTHTYYSDGQTSVMENVLAAKERGLKEIAVTDHCFASWLRGIKYGMKNNAFEKLIGEVESARSEMSVLAGVEANIISTDGTIDLTDEAREKLDIVIMGYHLAVAYKLNAYFTIAIPNVFFKFIRYVPKFQIRHNTNVMKRALLKNDIDVWAHPNKYFRVDVVEIAKVCVERDILIELNSPKIHLIRPIDFERMAALGAKFIIGSDAHCPKRVGDITRVEEFLRNCDYDPKQIINLNMTFTEYKNGQIARRNQDGDITPEEQQEPTPTRAYPPVKRKLFSRLPR
jgi:putative hydrolase